mmetsp:Transcript_0/g.2  ORF Transcript_0/g.2 Transcript_0/m.2 type:complete len:276 (-) Transcript_0:1366-2193(-)
MHAGSWHSCHRSLHCHWSCDSYGRCRILHCHWRWHHHGGCTHDAGSCLSVRQVPIRNCDRALHWSGLYGRSRSCNRCHRGTSSKRSLELQISSTGWGSSSHLRVAHGLARVDPLALGVGEVPGCKAGKAAGHSAGTHRNVGTGAEEPRRLSRSGCLLFATSIITGHFARSCLCSCLFISWNVDCSWLDALVMRSEVIKDTFALTGDNNVTSLSAACISMSAIAGAVTSFVSTCLPTIGKMVPLEQPWCNKLSTLVGFCLRNSLQRQRTCLFFSLP